MCLIKLENLNDDALIDDSIILELQGINAQPIPTIGQTVLTLKLGDLTKEFIFHVVPAGFKLRSDGVIGRNLLVELKANIDYGDRQLRIGLNKIPLLCPILTIAPRTEKIIQVVVNKNGEGIIGGYELEPGVYIPDLIVEAKQHKASVVVVNTTNHEINVSNIHCQISSLTSQPPLTKLDKIQEHLRVQHLTPAQQIVITRVCNEYRDIFYLPGDKLTATDTIQHEIPLLHNTPPVHVKPYRIPQAQKEEVDRQVKKMLEEGIVRPSSSPYNAPIVLVPKKLDNSGTQKWRLAVDMRRLNDVTIGDSFPLPNITEILDQLGNSKFYSALDLSAGYHQVLVKEEDRQKTAFSTGNAHYEFNRMPFGAKGAPAVFQRLMNTVLAGLIGNTCYVYLDDIIVYSTTLDEHEHKLRKVFDRLREHKLLLQPDKCNFFMPQIKFLGHIISEEGVTMDPEKVKAVVNYPVPETVKQIKSFLGLIGYYRRFIPQFAAMAKPLNNLTRKDVPFRWGVEQQEAFQNLKTTITSEPVLQYPDFVKGQFLLTTDASNIALGAILSQGAVGKDKPIAYASRTLNKAESNYSTSEKELLAIVWAVKHFRPYLYGRHFKILTDHRPLRWLFNVREVGSRLMRWRLKLEEYDYEIIYKAGKTNVNADALSRIQIELCKQRDSIETETFDKGEEETQITDSTINTSEPDSEHTESTPIIVKLHKDKAGNYRHWIDDKKQQQQLLKEYHDNPLGCHQGHQRTTEALKLRYYWQGMQKDVIDYINTCVSCNQRKTSRTDNRPAPLEISFTPNTPFTHTAMDIVGPLPLTRNGNRYLLTFQDIFTKYPEAIPMSDQSVNTIARKYVNHIICRHGCPEKITTDQGAQFTSELFSEICKLLQVKQIQTTAYHPEANGVVERSHQTLMNFLSHYINEKQDDWDEWIDYALMAYRTTPHTATGYSPYYLNHGREARLPTELQTSKLAKDYNEDDYVQHVVKGLQQAYENTQEKLTSGKERTKRNFDKNAQHKIFQPGELILLFDPTVKRGRSRKLKKPWLGPYKILERLSNVNYKIKKGKKDYVTHVNRMKPFRLRALD